MTTIKSNPITQTSIIPFKHTNHANFATNPSIPNPTILDISEIDKYKLRPDINPQPISSHYDWTRTSAQNYSIKYHSIDFIEYEYSKSLIDYKYHGYYTKDRQKQVHNPIIQYYKSIALHKLKTPEYLKDNPWVVFTAGPMGAGKTHTLQWLNNLGVFPLEAFLKISPDRIKKFLPEYKLYLQNDEENVGRMLRPEAGFLCEVIIWEILHSTNVCLWMDSSLRHVDFFRKMFNNLGIRFPKYKIGLVNIECDSHIVFERAKKRTEITGRHVAQIDIQRSIDQVPKSIQVLKHLADVVVHIDNNETPKLLQIQWNDKNKSVKPIIVNDPTWSMFSDVWTGQSSKL